MAPWLCQPLLCSYAAPNIFGATVRTFLFSHILDLLFLSQNDTSTFIFCVALQRDLKPANLKHSRQSHPFSEQIYGD